MSLKKSKKLKPDSFIGVNNIFSLKEDTFGSYINEKDVALVMFYNPKNAFSQLSKTHFIKATKASRRNNVAFAAVNCEDERRLCIAEHINDIPSLKLYSHGHVVGDQGVVSDYRKIVNALEQAPVLPPKPVSKTLMNFHS